MLPRWAETHWKKDWDLLVYIKLLESLRPWFVPLVFKRWGVSRYGEVCKGHLRYRWRTSRSLHHQQVWEPQNLDAHSLEEFLYSPPCLGSFGKVVWLFLLTHLNSVIFLGFCPLLHQLILAKGLFWPLFASVWHGPFFGTLDVVQIPQHFSGWWIERMDLSEFEFKVPDHRSLLGEPPRNCWDRWLDLLIGCWSNKELNYYLWKIWKEIKHYTLQFFGWRTV